MSSSNKLPSWMDADAWNAVSLGGTLVLRDSITEGKPELRDAGAVAISQYVYLKWGGDYLSGALAGITGEKMISGLAANALGLSVVFLGLEAVGLMKKGKTVIDEGGVAPKVKGKGMSKKVVNALIQSTELLIEQQVLMKIAGVAGVGIPAGAPAAALAK